MMDNFIKNQETYIENDYLNNEMVKSNVNESISLQIKIVIVAILVALLAVASGTWFVLDKHETTFLNNSLKVDSLYTELGDVKNENNNVYLELKKTQTELASLHAAIENTNDRLINSDPSEESHITVELSSLSDKFINNEKLKNAVNADGQVSISYPEDMVNVLLIGTNQSLTDTIMVASINPTTSEITLISVPRDLYANGRKINATYYYYGIDKLKQTINDVLGLKIDEYVIVDLYAFTKVVDALAGIDVYVEKDIYDSTYPTANKGYQLYNIKTGQYHMNGEEALKFARSRKSTSDFDRAKRQQIVIEAIFKKVKELKLSSDKDKAVDMYNILKEYVKTDLDVFSALAYMKMYKNYSFQRNNVLTSVDYLYSTINVSGAYILLPRSGNYDKIKSYVFELIAG